MSDTISIYADGLFGSDDSHLSDLMNSGVNTIILWSLHVHPNADLYYNNTLLASNGQINFGAGPGKINPNMPADLQRLRTGGVNTILFSIGAGGPPDPQDFQNIQNLLNNDQGRIALTRNFAALAKGLDLDGFDYDCEENNITVSTIALLTRILTPMGRTNTITFCPYGMPPEDFWLQCMNVIYTTMNKVQPVKWWNLQNYGGADPGQWIAEMKQYIKSNPIGVTNPNAFIFPGVTANGPDSVEQQFAQWQSQGLALQGGFIWNLSSIYQSGSTPKAYAKAMIAGLSSQSQRAAG